MTPADLLATPPSIEVYRRFRGALIPLHQRIIEAFVTSSILDKAARTLKLGAGRHLILDSENELSVLMDFGLYEIKVKGENLVQRYQREKSLQEGDLERQLLMVMARAQTSLFRVQQLRPHDGQVTLQELVQEQRQLTLMDINLSRSRQRGVIMFARTFDMGRFSTTSGVSFVFSAEQEARLLRQWGKLAGAKRYADYFMWSKRSGFEMHYME